MKKITGFLFIFVSLVVSAGLYLFVKNVFFLQNISRITSSLYEPVSIKHVGIIMDGNRRWAKKRGMQPWLGHKKGVEPIRETISFCLDHKIPYVTLYVFSLENFKRPQVELDYLFNILAQELATQEFEKLCEKGVKIQFLGDYTRFPQQLVSIIHDMQERTAHHSQLTLSLLFCYGGRQELVASMQHMGEKIKAGALDPATITEAVCKQHLWSGDLPDIDIIIRTAGDQRLSNFMPFQSAYSELFFLPCFWPELTRDDLEQVLADFIKRTRNFGV